MPTGRALLPDCSLRNQDWDRDVSHTLGQHHCTATITDTRRLPKCPSHRERAEAFLSKDVRIECEGFCSVPANVHFEGFAKAPGCPPESRMFRRFALATHGARSGNVVSGPLQPFQPILEECDDG